MNVEMCLKMCILGLDSGPITKNGHSYGLRSNFKSSTISDM